ncbi:cytochrome c biogenesis CcdA family protein [Terribacillus sp. AE2B 122]|uniref:cytochrome c biogenesis CcdA family protein n=1 Tax=Terribacillus sp. AE2B 122 TaxID=1331902 RepID=UPI001583381D|nr:cytochrome c biogenesis protein CcdA [Terribacillus sp. AE2B 122]
MEVTILLAVTAGFLSFLSPCVLPLYPAFLSYLAGVNPSSPEKEKHASGWFLHTIFFLIGFSSIFLLLGYSALALSEWLFTYQSYIRVFGGIILIMLGALQIGLLGRRWQTSKTLLRFKSRPPGYTGSLLIGLSFAMGWTPCTGPILAGIMTSAALQPLGAVPLMTAYVLGFSIPFFIWGFFGSRLQKLKRTGKILHEISGYFLILIGVLLLFDLTTKITSYLASFFSFYGF